MLCQNPNFNNISCGFTGLASRFFAGTGRCAIVMFFLDGTMRDWRNRRPIFGDRYKIEAERRWPSIRHGHLRIRYEFFVFYIFEVGVLVWGVLHLFRDSGVVFLVWVREAKSRQQSKVGVMLCSTPQSITSWRLANLGSFSLWGFCVFQTSLQTSRSSVVTPLHWHESWCAPQIGFHVLGNPFAFVFVVGCAYPTLSKTGAVPSRHGSGTIQSTLEWIFLWLGFWFGKVCSLDGQAVIFG